MFAKIQVAAVAAFLASSALAYTPADADMDAVVTVTLTNTKTYCPCEATPTGLSGWESWSPTGGDKTWTSTSKKPWSTSSTSTSVWTSYSTTSSYSYSTTSSYSYSTTSSSSYTTSSTSSYTTASTTSETTTSTAKATPTPFPGCKVVDWTPGTCEDNTAFAFDGYYIYQACERKLLETDNYLDDYLEALCEVTPAFDDSFKAAAWEESTGRCYVYADDDDFKQDGYYTSPVSEAGNVNYAIKFDSNPCEGFVTY